MIRGQLTYTVTMHVQNMHFPQIGKQTKLQACVLFALSDGSGYPPIQTDTHPACIVQGQSPPFI